MKNNNRKLYLDAGKISSLSNEFMKASQEGRFYKNCCPL